MDKLENKYARNKAALKNVGVKSGNTKRTVKKLKRKVQSLHVVIITLKNKQLISVMASENLTKSFSSILREIMARILKNRRSKGLSRSKYSLELPHPSTIRKIHSGIECKSGFTQSSFEVRRLKSDQCKSNKKELICSLIVDDMVIKSR